MPPLTEKQYRDCPFCTKPVWVVLTTCPQCLRRARTGVAAVDPRSIDGYYLAMWQRDRSLAPPEFWYPPINPVTGERSPAYRPDTEEPATRRPDLVTLDQAAAIVNMSKRTLERYKTKGALPSPAVEGGGGKADRYDWTTMRAWLIETFKIDLPEKFPRPRPDVG